MLKHGSCVCTPVTEVLPERLAWSVVNNHGSLCIIVQVGKLPLLSLLSLTQGGKSSQICKKKNTFGGNYYFCFKSTMKKRDPVFAKTHFFRF